MPQSATPYVPVPLPLTYSIGGSVAGLSGTVVLQNNGTDNLPVSSNGAFAFDVTVQPDSSYNVTIATQPANQVCTVSNGSGTAAASVSNVVVACSLSSTATDVWTWVAGSDFVNAAGVYGTQGTAAPTNTPGARREPISWTDATGNFWLFGGNGVGNVGMLDDLWEFVPATGEWAWQGGSEVLGAAASYGTQGAPAAGNNPGAREGSAKWTDAAAISGCSAATVSPARTGRTSTTFGATARPADCGPGSVARTLRPAR